MVNEEMLLDKQKLMKDISSDEDFKDGDIFQAILNVGYHEWQKEEHQSDWGCDDMINWVGETYGLVAKFAVLVGKYNQQVCNGGHLQYWDNAYASSGEPDEEIELHKEMISLMEKFNLHRVSELGYKIHDIMVRFQPEVDNVRYITDDEYWDDELEEYVKDDYENDHFGQIDNDYLLSELDSEYYKICEEWMDWLGNYFSKVVAGVLSIVRPSAKIYENIEKTESIEEKKNKKPKVKLVGEDGNAFAILGRVRSALRKAGYSQEHIKKFMDEATSGDYNNLLQICMKYVEIS